MDIGAWILFAVVVLVWLAWMAYPYIRARIVPRCGDLNGDFACHYDRGHMGSHQGYKGGVIIGWKR